MMKAPKVLMVGPARSVHGGISGVVNNYYEAGLDEKIELCYIGTMVEGSKLRKLLKAGTSYVQFLFKLSKYDIVHVNVASDASYVRKSFFIKSAKRAGKKIIIHQHGGDFEGYYGSLSDKDKKKVKEVLSMGDEFLVLAPAWKEFFGTIIDKEKITVFPDSIKVPEAFDKAYGQKKVLFLGRLCKAKGIGELLWAWKELSQKHPTAHLFLGGIWEDKELETVAKAQSDSVTYLGWLTGEEKQKYLRECDIFVLPSYFEGQSVAILEAMAYSCGIVASKTGGIPQMITEGETGIFAKPEDVETLKVGLDRLLENPAFCAELGKNARKKVEQEFSIEENMRKLISIYEGLI